MKKTIRVLCLGSLLAVLSLPAMAQDAPIQPDGMPDMAMQMGQIISVEEGSITLQLSQAQQPGEMQRPEGQTPPDGQAGDAPALPDGQNGEPGQGTAPQGGGPGGGGRGQGGGMQMTFDGEQVTLTLGAEAQITAMSGAQDVQALTLGDLASGDIVRYTLNDSGAVATLEKVQQMEAPDAGEAV